MKKQPHGEVDSDEEIARRRDDVIRRMANTPPQLHKPLGKSKPESGARPKKRGRPRKGTLNDLRENVD